MTGGWIAQHYGAAAVNLVCGLLALTWLLAAATMSPPPRRVVPAAAR
jgi:hypothetical protein